jgi:hypothetical protein
MLVSLEESIMVGWWPCYSPPVQETAEQETPPAGSPPPASSPSFPAATPSGLAAPSAPSPAGDTVGE